MKSQFPGLAGRIAAGRILGSDVLGGDDEISRDHDWGPQFDLYLSVDDYARFGENLSAAMNAAAPNPWNGYRLAGAGDKSVRVESIPDWFLKYLQMDRLPTAAAEWPPFPFESTLYFLRYGEIWVDAPGEFTRWRAALHEYPEERLAPGWPKNASAFGTTVNITLFNEWRVAATRSRLRCAWANSSPG